MHPAPSELGAPRVFERIIERARARLIDRGIEPNDAFPARLVRDLIPAYGGRRMCLEAIYRAIARGHLEAVRIGREWFCDLESFRRWLARRAGMRGGEVVEDAGAAPEADAMHAAVSKRLIRKRPSG